MRSLARAAIWAAARASRASCAQSARLPPITSSAARPSRLPSRSSSPASMTLSISGATNSGTMATRSSALQTAAAAPASAAGVVGSSSRTPLATLGHPADDALRGARTGHGLVQARPDRRQAAFVVQQFAGRPGNARRVDAPRDLDHQLLTGELIGQRNRVGETLDEEAHRAALQEGTDEGQERQPVPGSLQRNDLRFVEGQDDDAGYAGDAQLE